MKENLIAFIQVFLILFGAIIAWFFYVPGLVVKELNGSIILTFAVVCILYSLGLTVWKLQHRRVSMWMVGVLIIFFILQIVIFGCVIYFGIIFSHGFT